VSVTDAGRRLVESAGPAFGQIVGALGEASARPGEAVGRLRLSVPRTAVPFVIDPVVPTFRARHPRVEVDVVVEERLVDIVGEGFDAGVRLTEAIERDLVQVRLTDAFRFVVVGAPSYLARHGAPERPEDLLRHECITLRSQTTGALYAWELERGRRSWPPAGRAAGPPPVPADRPARAAPGIAARSGRPCGLAGTGGALQDDDGHRQHEERNHQEDHLAKRHPELLGAALDVLGSLGRQDEDAPDAGDERDDQERLRHQGMSGDEEPDGVEQLHDHEDEEQRVERLERALSRRREPRQ
jgi:DNA-binding transcriptional LysR family regulator